MKELTALQQRFNERAGKEAASHDELYLMYIAAMADNEKLLHVAWRLAAQLKGQMTERITHRKSHVLAGRTGNQA